MFNFIKALLAVSFIKANKKSIIILLVCILIILLSIFISNDLVKVVSKEDKSLVLLIKWSIVIIFTIISLFTIRNIFKTNIVLIKNSAHSNKKEDYNKHKSDMLRETGFESKGESIIKKYKKDNV